MNASIGRSNPPQVDIQSLTHSYGGKPALADVTLTVPAGSFTVLLGPSGSGKSTLLRCIAGIERPTSGTIRLGGEIVSGRRLHVPAERRDLAMVFQDYALWPHMTALETVAFALRRRGLDRRSIRERSARMLDAVGLAGLHGRYSADLSGGEQQRVALARALVASPGLLLFDEPLSNLDADLRERLRVEIGTHTREIGATAIYITHDQSEAFALADQIGVLQMGRLVQLSTPEDLYHSPANPFVARFTGLAGELEGTVTQVRSDGIAAVRCGPTDIIGRLCGGTSARSGERARVLIRASAIAVNDDGPGCSVTGTVRDVAFRGRGYDHVVELPGGEQFTGVFDARRYGRMQDVRLQFHPNGCLVFPDETTREVPHPANGLAANVAAGATLQNPG